MSAPQIEIVLLDMGGVILQMAGSRGFPAARLDWRGRQALLRAISKAGGRSDLDELERLVFSAWRLEHGRRAETGHEASWSPFLDRLRRASGCDLEDSDLLGAWFRPYGEQLQPIAGAVAALAELDRAGYRLGLISNVPLPGELYLRLLKKHGAASFFEKAIFSYDHGSRKPSPAMLRAAMAHFEVAPAATVMVGDRRDRDIAAGRFAGTRTVWVRSVDSGGPPADAEIESIVELPNLLESWKR